MKKQLISAVVAAAMITGAMGNFAIPVVPEIQSITASAASVADFQGTYNVPVTLINATTGGTSMGNAALKQTGTLVIDSQGKATVKLEFHSLTIGSDEGYLGFLRKKTDTGYKDLDVLDRYVGIYDIYNTPGGQYTDSNVVGMWYPKVLSIPVDVTIGGNGKVIGTGKNGTDVDVQVYVPVMEKIQAGGGTQPAILRISWDQMEEQKTSLAGSQLNVSGDIVLNNYIKASEEIANDPAARVVTSVDNYTSESAFSSSNLTANGYAFPVEVPARCMAQDITIDVKNGAGEIVDSYKVSIREYAMRIISGDEFTEKQKNMAKALLNYGAYAQTYFAVKNGEEDPGKLPNDGFSNDDKKVTVKKSSFNDYGFTETGKASNVGLKYKGSCLTLASETAIKHFFMVGTSTNVDDLTFTVTEDGAASGRTVKPVLADAATRKYYIPITGISAANLAKPYTLTVQKKGASNSYSITYCALDYCKLVINDENEDEDESIDALQKVAKALYLLYSSAK